MHIRQRTILAALFLSALVLAACGAKQGRQVELKANWNALYDAVPADASYSLGHIVGEEGTLSDALHGSIGTLFNTNLATVASVLAQESLLKESELTAFSRKGADWLIVEVSDLPHAMESLANHYRTLDEGYGDSVTLEEDRVGERVVLRLKDAMHSDEAAYVETTGVGNYIIARVSMSSDEARVEKDMRALSKGWDEVGRYAATEDGAAQRARAGGRELSSWAWINMKALNAQIQEETQQAGLAGILQMVRPDDPNASEACATLNAELEALVPSVHVNAFSGADGKQQTEVFMRLSNEGVANGRTVMRGAPSLKGFGQKALLSLGISFDFGAFFESLTADPAQANCVGFAGYVGQIAEELHEFSNHIKFNARTVTGTGALVVEDLNLEGFIPTANVGVFIESPNAEALFQRIVRALSKHGSAEVRATASVPSIEVSLTGMPIRLRVEQGEDRVIVTTSGMNEALVSRLLTIEPHNDDAVPFELEVNGEQLRKARQDAVQYVEDMQMEDPRLDSLLELIEDSLSGLHARAQFEADGLRLIVKQKD